MPGRSLGQTGPSSQPPTTTIIHLAEYVRLVHTHPPSPGSPQETMTARPRSWLPRLTFSISSVNSGDVVVNHWTRVPEDTSSITCSAIQVSLLGADLKVKDLRCIQGMLQHILLQTLVTKDDATVVTNMPSTSTYRHNDRPDKPTIPSQPDKPTIPSRPGVVAASLETLRKLLHRKFAIDHVAKNYANNFAKHYVNIFAKHIAHRKSYCEAFCETPRRSQITSRIESHFSKSDTKQVASFETCHKACHATMPSVSYRAKVKVDSQLLLVVLQAEKAHSGWRCFRVSTEEITPIISLTCRPVRAACLVVCGSCAAVKTLRTPHHRFGIIGLYILPKLIKETSYPAFLENGPPGFLVAVPQQIHREMRYMHYRAPAHFSITVREYLDTMYSQRWIGRRCLSCDYYTFRMHAEQYMQIHVYWRVFTSPISLSFIHGVRPLNDEHLPQPLLTFIDMNIVGAVGLLQGDPACPTSSHSNVHV
ncbi:hypothetical protein PR048_006033 [Dryococelus australis]|uniref:Uncharacterized protein n=1 Tax=Dryococelus australis TaxID=614101 RepID=A0ABQ9I9U0_9NEOP|nr:hypothetical protein PR048_006033 [Dryococelus australis]